MKKILIAIVCILFGVAASAQLQQQSLGGSVTTLSTTQGGLMGKLYFILPKKDTLNNAATGYVGALTVRPQDTIATLYPPIYMSNGHFWISVGSGANGIDSITVSPDSTLYRAYNKGNQIFTFSTLLRNVKAGTNVTFTWDVDTLVINSAAGSVVTDSTQWAVSDSLSTPAVSPNEGTIYLVGLFATGAFSGHENQIATYDSVPAIYTFQSADLGDLLYNANNGVVSVWTGTAWVWVGKLIIHHPNDNYGFALSLGTLGAFPVAIRTTNTPRITIGANGDVTFNGYTSGHTGTPTGGLNVDATGKIIIGATSSVPNLQQVTDVGNVTTRSIYVDSLVATSDAVIHTVKVGRGVTSRGGDSLNIAIGRLALNANTTGYLNSTLGDSALKSNTTGTSNTAIGFRVLPLATTASFNTVIGANTMPIATTGGTNTVVGSNTLTLHTTGTSNTVIGAFSMGVNTSGSTNVVIGFGTMNKNTSGSSNVAIGNGALTQNTTVNNNVAIGTNALSKSVTGVENVGIGALALQSPLGSSNTGIGYNSLSGLTNSVAYSNTAIGARSLSTISTGIRNTAIGDSVFNLMNTGSYNTGIGYNISTATLGTSNGIAFGANTVVASNQLAISDSITSMKFKNLDSATGTAPSVIGKDGAGAWHVYSSRITGTATLVAGTVTVSSTSVSTTSRILYSVRTAGGTQGNLSAPTASVVNATSFVINSTSATETSTVDWWIIN